MRQRSRIDAELIITGREKGYLTYNDISDALPDEVISAEEIDDIWILWRSWVYRS